MYENLKKTVVKKNLQKIAKMLRISM